MRVDWAILCRFAEVNDSLFTIVAGGLDNYTVPAFPNQLQLVVAIRIVGLPDTAAHSLEMRVLDPMLAPVGQPTPPATFTLAPPGPAFPAGWETHVPVCAVVAVPVDQPGTYTLDLSLDGHSHTMPFRVSGP